MFFSWISDKYRQRAAILAVQVLITIIGLALTGFAASPGWRYAGDLLEFTLQRSLIDLFYLGIFLSNAGSGGCIPGIIAYVGVIFTMQEDFRFIAFVYQSSNNIVTHTKRATSTALIVSFGGLGGILASLTFRQRDFPHYLPGIYAMLGCQLLLLTLLAITKFLVGGDRQDHVVILFTFH